MTFIASMMTKVWPFLTVSPTETKLGLSGPAAKYATPTSGLSTRSPSATDSVTLDSENASAAGVVVGACGAAVGATAGTTG